MLPVFSASVCSAAARSYPYESPGREKFRKFLYVAMPVTGIATLGFGFLYPDEDQLFPTQPSRTNVLQQHDETVINWSSTHEARPKIIYQPETTAQVSSCCPECVRVRACLCAQPRYS